MAGGPSISREIVAWREGFRAQNGRNPAKSEVPDEVRALLKQLAKRKAKGRAPEDGPSLIGPAESPQKSRCGYTSDASIDSHVSASPRKNKGCAIPRRSGGRLPGATSTAQPARGKRVRTLESRDEIEAVLEMENAAEAEGENCTSFGNLFEKVADILQDPPSPLQSRKRKSGGESSEPREGRVWRPKRKIKTMKKLRGFRLTKTKVTQSNFCQVSASSNFRNRRAGKKSSGNRSKTLRPHSVPFETLLEGEIPQDLLQASRESQDEVQNVVDEALLAEMRDRLLSGSEDDSVTDFLKSTFAFSSFREGQLEVIRRVLKGQSSLVVKPTGYGKSLLYLFPALVMDTKAPIVVISPLLSLMKDQMSKVPSAIPHDMLSSGLSGHETAAILQKIRSNKLKIVFVSPERLYSRAFIQAFQSIGAPPPFVCIDEAHCISEWSHNFRPAYFRLGRVLYEELKVQCVLALTATATRKSVLSICNVLRMSSQDVMKDVPLRDNLHLRVSELDGGSINDSILALLRPGGVLESKESLIIYCNFQLETEVIAAHLYTNGVAAKAYHAGLAFAERGRVQDLFCKGKLRVVVATVAFGMGLDKRDVDAIIHSEMPRSLEGYVQQIGRAGRDGRDAVCHLFHSKSGYECLRSLCHSDCIDEDSVFQLLNRVFGERVVNSECSQNRIGILPLQKTSVELDIKESVIETILTFLEDMQNTGASQDPTADEEPNCHGSISLLQPLVGHMCEFSFFKPPQELAENVPLVEHIIKHGKKKVASSGIYHIEIHKLAELSKMSLLQIQETVHIMQQMKHARCELQGNSLCYRIWETPKNKRSIAQQIASRLHQAFKSEKTRLGFLHGLLSKAHEASSDGDRVLKDGIVAYFDSDASLIENTDEEEDVDRFLQRDIRVFIQANRHLLQRKPSMPPLTGRAIARVLQGISSPSYPAYIWGRNTMWKRYIHLDFEVIAKLATKEIIWHINNKLK